MFQNKSFPGKEREFAPRTAGTVLNDETDAGNLREQQQQRFHMANGKCLLKYDKVYLCNRKIQK